MILGKKGQNGLWIGNFGKGPVHLTTEKQRINGLIVANSGVGIFSYLYGLAGEARKQGHKVIIINMENMGIDTMDISDLLGYTPRELPELVHNIGNVFYDRHDKAFDFAFKKDLTFIHLQARSPAPINTCLASIINYTQSQAPSWLADGLDKTFKHAEKAAVPLVPLKDSKENREKTKTDKSDKQETSLSKRMLSRYRLQDFWNVRQLRPAASKPAPQEKPVVVLWFGALSFGNTYTQELLNVLSRHSNHYMFFFEHSGIFSKLEPLSSWFNFRMILNPFISHLQLKEMGWEHHEDLLQRHREQNNEHFAVFEHLEKMGFVNYQDVFDSVNHLKSK